MNDFLLIYLLVVSMLVIYWILFGEEKKKALFNKSQTINDHSQKEDKK